MNRSKRLGTSWETAVVEYLRANGHPHAERRALSGSSDKGDIAGVIGVVVECKNAKTIELAAWIAELRQEMENAGADVGWLVIKRRGKASPADAYWVTTGKVALDLLAEWDKQ